MKEIKQAPVLNGDGQPVGILRYLDVAVAKIQGTGGGHQDELEGFSRSWMTKRDVGQ